MRALLQRVSNANVVVDGAVVGQIGNGIMALIGIAREDTDDDIRWLVNKVLSCRIFEHEGKHWHASAKALDYEILLVSQFTLHASTKKPKPDFHRSASTEHARALFEAVVSAFKKEHKPERIHTGVFGAMMSVSLCNEGPVTLWIDSKNRDDLPWEAVTATGLASPSAASTPVATPSAAGTSGHSNSKVSASAATSNSNDSTAAAVLASSAPSTGTDATGSITAGVASTALQ